jgi:hypothetical protein
MERSKTILAPQQQDNGQSRVADPGNAKLMADVEQFLYYHRSADLTAESLQIRLLLAILKLQGPALSH